EPWPLSGIARRSVGSALTTLGTRLPNTPQRFSASGATQAFAAICTHASPRSPIGVRRFMCGIAGILGPDADRERVQRMADAQRHRGPDDKGEEVFTTGVEGVNLALGHRRLAILDLSAAGHQPMHDRSSGLWTVYNGEIYNHLELRK